MPLPIEEVRVAEAERRQLELVARDLESLISADHIARAVWAFVEGLDLSAFYSGILVGKSTAGRTAIDPKVLLALWLYATVEGEGSAREIVRLTECHDAYRWLRGRVPLNHHTLSDFRTSHQEALDAMFTQSIAVLLKEELVTLKRVAQDGTRVRASAGTNSFRRKESLEDCLRQAEEQVCWVKRAAAALDNNGRAAAQERAAEDRRQRVENALRQLPEVQARRDKKSKGAARVSTTDPDARVMKMSHGGYRPAFNVQFATDVEGQAVVGVAVTNSPSDSGQLPPMLDQIERRCGRKPDAALVDSGYTDRKSIEAADKANVLVYGPLPNQSLEAREGKRFDPERLEPRAEDSEAIVHFKLRMKSEEGRSQYKLRAQSAELTNAWAKENHGLTRFRVRGSNKVTCVALWVAITINFLRLHAAGFV